MPILSPQWTSAYGNAAANVGQNGFNQPQQAGIDYYNYVLANPNTYVSGPVLDATMGARQHAGEAVNDYWGAANGLSREFAQVNQNGLAPIFNTPPPQLTGDVTSANPLSVSAATGASMSTPYASLYGTAVTDPSLAAYDYGTDRAFSALDARTAGAGAFGNSRSGLAYSDLGSQSALGRGQLASGLLSQGAQAAFALGQQDASRDLAAQSTNAGNILNNNQFNASLLNNRQQFNANAQFQSDQDKLQAAQQWSGNVAQRQQMNNDLLAARLGMTQQDLTNTNAAFMTRQGIDADAAQKLVNAGGLTFGQLAQLAQLAQAANGYKDDKSGSSTTNTTSNNLNFKLSGLF